MFDLKKLLSAYTDLQPDPAIPSQRVSFGTSGHRGSALRRSFNEPHIAAITQAVVDWRRLKGLDGPVYLGMDTHALSGPAHDTVARVLAGNGQGFRSAMAGEYTPTPLISRAIIEHNRRQDQGVADGLILTPSHNPPEDGGIKYNGPDGGPAPDNVTRWIGQRANALLAGGMKGMPLRKEKDAAVCREYWNFVEQYLQALPEVVDMQAIARAGLSLGVDPMGGSSLVLWEAIARRWSLQLKIVNREQSPGFEFMPPDHDGQIRMDCSSTAAMANLIAVRDRFDLAFANDPDADRHGIVGPEGLINPNQFLAVCVDYLIRHRLKRVRRVAVGKTLVSSSMIDRVAHAFGYHVQEVPVGFKWFVEGLGRGQLLFAGEESAGASLLQFDGRPWTTDKDGIALCLLAAEIRAVTGRTPHQYYRELEARHGRCWYQRVDAPVTDELRSRLASLDASRPPVATLAGSPVRRCLTHLPDSGQAIGGVKVVTDRGWFTVRPSGTEPVYKLYAESFVSEEHLQQLTSEAREMVSCWS